MVRRLHQRQPWVAQEPADRQLQKGAGRHMVAVEQRQQLAVGHRQRVIEVARLGV
jgi:hypothetical protein